MKVETKVRVWGRGEGEGEMSKRNWDLSKRSVHCEGEGE